MRKLWSKAAVISIVASLAFVGAPAAHADTIQITCADASGTVVLKIKAPSSAVGLHKAVKMAAVAETQLGVTCTDTSGTKVAVPNAVRVVCTNADGDVVLKIAANEAALDGLGTAVDAFAKRAGQALGLTCTVSTG
jgi:hypothetical protein